MEGVLEGTIWLLEVPISVVIVVFIDCQVLYSHYRLQGKRGVDGGSERGRLEDRLVEGMREERLEECVREKKLGGCEREGG